MKMLWISLVLRKSLEAKHKVTRSSLGVSTVQAEWPHVSGDNLLYSENSCQTVSIQSTAFGGLFVRGKKTNTLTPWLQGKQFVFLGTKYFSSRNYNFQILSFPTVKRSSDKMSGHILSNILLPLG